MKQIVRVVWLLALASAFGEIAASPAAAQTSAGIRAGLSVNPDQFYFGGHVETPPLVDQLRFKPNIEIGVGNDVTVVALNVEFAYVFPSQRDWNVYAGAASTTPSTCVTCRGGARNGPDSCTAGTEGRRNTMPSSRSAMVVAAMLAMCACSGSPSGPTKDATLRLLI